MKRKLTYAGIGAVVIIIVIITLSLSSSTKADLNTITVHPQLFTNTVSVSGKVVAADSVDLGFEQSGRVSRVIVKVGSSVKKGDTIAEIDNADVSSQIEQKRATFHSQQAKLASLEAGTRTEELTIYQQKYDDAATNLSTAIHTARLQADDAIINKIDNLFTNGDTINPTLNIPIGNPTLTRNLELERFALKNTLEAWSNSISKSDLTSMRVTSQSALNATKNFIEHLSVSVASVSSVNSGLNQTVIESYRATLNTAGQIVTTAMNAFQNSDANWSSTRDALALAKAGATTNDIAVQTALVNSAEADMQNAMALLGKKIIFAPFEGIITKMNLKVGQIVSPSTSEISLISNGIFQVETFIPEVNIASIKINNTAKITLDAYGADTFFFARVISIDPGVTIRDGVSTYKVTLEFNAKDDRIKSGMTANTLITTDSRENALVIPSGALIRKSETISAQIKTDSGPKTVEVKTGLLSNAGQVEIVSGLQDGDVVILNPTN